MAIPSSHKNTRLHSEHLLWESLWQSHPVAVATDSLILSNTGPCTVNRETNCVCSGNFNHDECDNILTTATVAKGFYTNHEDCDLEWSETVELAVPYFQTESGYDVLTVDHHCANKAMDTAYYSGDGTGLDGSKACSMHWRTDVSVFGGGFKVCGISLGTDPGGKPPKGGGTVAPDQQACPCGTNAGGTQPAGHALGGRDAAEDKCFTNPKWPCPRASINTSSASGTQLKTKHSWAKHSWDEAQLDVYAILVNTSLAPYWAEDVDAILARDNVKASVGCCVCKGGWMAGYDPTGDQATETELGEMARPECTLF